MANLTGTALNDTLVSTAGDDVLDGAGGIDTASYASAAAGVTLDLAMIGPQATGGAGSDTLISIENLVGSAFNDRLTGDSGVNLLIGGAGGDTLEGGGGDDTLRGGAGDDILDGGAGFDYAEYSDARAAVTISLAMTGAQATGGAGQDVLRNIEGLIGSVYADVLTGGDGTNKLSGGYGNDTLRGGAGDDTLDGGDGDDVLEGGDGFDTADFSLAAYNMTADLSQGSASGGSGRDALVSIERVIGGLGADTLKAGSIGATLIGGLGADSLYGGAGDDTLDAGEGDDALYVGAGADKVSGGAGNDTIHFIVDATALTIDLSTLWGGGQYASGGLMISGVELLGSVTGGVMSDTVIVGETYTGATTLNGGGGDDRLTGGGGADTVAGGDGDDLLSGGGGRDVVNGGAGADTLNGGAGDDALVIDGGDREIDGGSGTDTLSFDWGTNKYASQALNIDLTNLWTGGFGLINGGQIRGIEKIEAFNGSDLADRILFGSGPADYSTRLAVSLGDGDDYAVGGSGGDYLDGGAGNDTLYGGAGGDFLLGGVGSDQLNGGDGDDTFYVGSNDSVDGGAGRDVLRFSIDVTSPAFNIDLRALWSGGVGAVNGGAIVNVEDLYDIGGTSSADTIIIGDGLITKITHNPYEEMGREVFNGLILRGYSGDDTIVGSGGADKIYGDQGADKISGGAGDDIIVFDGKDSVDGGAGVDTLQLGDWYFRPAEALELDLRGNWDGTAGATITNIEKFFGGYGSDYSDLIIVGDNYTLNGVELSAGSGDDTVVGSGLADTLEGSYGADQLSGGAGNDILGGSGGDDLLDGGADNDTAVFGGDASDYSWTINADGSLTVRDLRDPVTYAYAYSGVDTLRNIELLRFSDKTVTLGAKTGLTITGASGPDVLVGGPDNDTLGGGGGDDTLIGGLGDDVLDGGAGFDIVSFAEAAGPVNVALFWNGQQKNTGQGFDLLTSIEGIIGSAYADTLSGGDGADSLKGGAGDDILEGRGGDDIVDGGDGGDTLMIAGFFSDYTWVAGVDGAYTVKSIAGGGTTGVDTVRNVEVLQFLDKAVTLAGLQVFNGTSGDDQLRGTSGADLLRGGDGNDLLFTSGGDDTFDGGAERDIVYFLDAAGPVTVDLASAGAQDTGQGRDTFISIEGLVGSAFNDKFQGDAAANAFNGGDGDDQLDGRDGDDSIGGDAGNDTIHGGAGADGLTGGSGNDFIYGDAGDDRISLQSETTDRDMGADYIDGGDGVDTVWVTYVNFGVSIDLRITTLQQISPAFTLTIKNVEKLHGWDFADRLTGDAADNELMGWGGDDIIDGGAGVDTVVMRGSSGDFTVTWTPTGWLIADKRPYVAPSQLGSSSIYDGVDTVRNVEFIAYYDKIVALGDGMPLVVGNILRSESASLAGDLSTRLSAGSINATQALSEVVSKAGATTSVATLAYAFFTGKIPGEAGIDYLVSPTGPNANNLNSAYYQSFNLENRYINFAVNLGKLGEGKDAFLAKYGALNFVEATREAYKTIFGAAPTDAKIHAMIDSRIDYFAAYGGDGGNGIGTKAAMVGWLLAEAQKADLGVMVKSNNAWLADLADGSAPFAVDILDPAKGYYKADFIFGGA